MTATPVVMLAQIQGTPQARPLPAPPLVEHLLLESPLPLVILCVLGAIGALALFNQRGRARLGLGIAGALLLAGAGIWTLATLVTTDREAMIDRTGRLIDAVAAIDVPAIEELLSVDVRLFSLPRGAPVPMPRGGLGKSSIIDLVRRYMGGEFALKEHRIMEIGAVAPSPSLGRTRCQVRVVHEATGLPHTSWWRLTWHKDPDGQWRAVTIEPLALEGDDLAG